MLEALGVGMEVGAATCWRAATSPPPTPTATSPTAAPAVPSNDENHRLVSAMQAALDEEDFAGRREVRLQSGEGHRFVLRLRGADLSARLDDTDPQATGVPPEPAAAAEGASGPEVERTVALVRRAVAAMERAIAGEPKANRALLRGFSSLPHLPSMDELYAMRCGAFAGYPLYRGVASVCGMEVVECGKQAADVVDAVAARWDDFDYFFLHVKQADMAGEDGDADAKVAPSRRSTRCCRACSSSARRWSR